MAPDKISVIIVTYNVSKFITFCIDSIYRSSFSGVVQIVVVDNNSNDNTIEKIEKEYPTIEIIKNDSNRGFSKACNQGVEKSEGEFVLFLNPDCIIAENTLQVLYECFNDGNIGSVGPLLIDGSGRVLPESAREIPTTKNAVTKLFKLPFKRSYPYYRKIKSSNVLVAPILCGACMLLRREVFVEVGGFDERFFMYGEDIDLSLRLVQSGYTNYCIPQATVIHFKGESTDRGTLKNNSNFYNAIKLYAAKHNDSLTSSYRQIGLGLVSKVMPILKFVKEHLSRALPALSDFLIIISAFLLIQVGWSFYKYGNIFYFGTFKYLNLYLVYSIVWIITLIYQGVYFSKEKITSVYKGALFGGVINMLLFALFPFEWRFSRAILLLSSFIVPLLISVKYLLAYRLKELESIFVTNSPSNSLDSQLYASNSIKSLSIDSMMSLMHPTMNIVDFNSVSIRRIIQIMRRANRHSKFDFFDSQRELVFSSETQKKRGEGLDINRFMRLSQRKYLLQKRTLDILIIFLFFPFFLIAKLLMLKPDYALLHSIWNGEKTCVGYSKNYIEQADLPSIPESILNCYPLHLHEKDKKQSSVDYAFNYSIFDDLYILTTQLKTFIKAFI